MNFIKKSILVITAAFLLEGCSKDFLDVNDDPTHPVEVNEETLLPRAEQYAAFSLGYSRGNVEIGLSEILGVYSHQMVLREDPDQYGGTGSEFNLSGAWDTFYSNALPDLDAIIKYGTQKGNMKYVGVAKILKAYLFSQFVDAFGDIPFSEANHFAEGIRNAKFDNDEEIYPKLITMLDEGISDVNNESALNLDEPGENDIIYKGDTENWTKAANTIKLKLYNQIRLTTNVSAQVTALLSQPDNLISATDESFMFSFGTGISPDDRNPAFNDYVATQKSRYVSPWFYEIMKGYNGQILTNIEDPRIPYYWFNQIGAASSTAYPTEYRDGAFVSILFGSVGINRDWPSDGYMTVFGIYPAGGRYDDGKPQAVKGSSGTGAAPFRFLTYADRLFIEAELMSAGVIQGDAKAKLKDAIEESFKQVDFVVEKAKLASQAVPTLSGSEKANAYIDAVMNSPKSNTLELIMTEKWISSFGNQVDQYSDYRRTGFPILFDPKVFSQGFQPPVNGNPLVMPQNPVPVQLSRSYPLSLPWPQSELETNGSAPEQKLQSSYSVFWDK